MRLITTVCDCGFSFVDDLVNKSPFAVGQVNFSGNTPVDIEADMIFTALAELSTRQIAETMVATGLAENKVAGKSGGGIARKARVELEGKTGKSVVTGEHFLPPVAGNAPEQMDFDLKAGKGRKKIS